MAKRTEVLRKKGFERNPEEDQEATKGQTINSGLASYLRDFVPKRKQVGTQKSLKNKIRKKTTSNTGGSSFMRMVSTSQMQRTESLPLSTSRKTSSLINGKRHRYRQMRSKFERKLKEALQMKCNSDCIQICLKKIKMLPKIFIDHKDIVLGFGSLEPTSSGDQEANRSPLDLQIENKGLVEERLQNVLQEIAHLAQEDIEWERKIKFEKEKLRMVFDKEKQINIIEEKHKEQNILNIPTEIKETEEKADEDKGQIFENIRDPDQLQKERANELEKKDQQKFGKQLDRERNKLKKQYEMERRKLEKKKLEMQKFNQKLMDELEKKKGVLEKKLKLEREKLQKDYNTKKRQLEKKEREIESQRQKMLEATKKSEPTERTMRSSSKNHSDRRCHSSLARGFRPRSKMQYSSRQPSGKRSALKSNSSGSKLPKLSTEYGCGHISTPAYSGDRGFTPIKPEHNAKTQDLGTKAQKNDKKNVEDQEISNRIKLPSRIPITFQSSANNLNDNFSKTELGFEPLHPIPQNATKAGILDSTLQLSSHFDDGNVGMCKSAYLKPKETATRVKCHSKSNEETNEASKVIREKTLPGISNTEPGPSIPSFRYFPTTGTREPADSYKEKLIDSIMQGMASIRLKGTLDKNRSNIYDGGPRNYEDDVNNEDSLKEFERLEREYENEVAENKKHKGEYATPHSEVQGKATKTSKVCKPRPAPGPARRQKPSLPPIRRLLATGASEPRVVTTKRELRAASKPGFSLPDIHLGSIPKVETLKDGEAKMPLFPGLTGQGDGPTKRQKEILKECKAFRKDPRKEE